MDRRAALKLSTAAGVSAVLTACARRPADMPPAATGTDTIMFIRHGEEPETSDGSAGVTELGAADRRSLSVRGWTRAGALVALFDPRAADGKPLPTRAQLSRPTKIFASDPGKNNSRRSLETVAPLAAALNLEVDTRFTSTQTEELAEALSVAGGSVLVAWKHEQIAEIISHLAGVTPSAPPWPDGRYDLIYVLTKSGGGWRFETEPQMLLDGDREAPAG